MQFWLSKLPQTVQVCDLCLNRVVGAIKPELAIRAAVNAERPANGIAKAPKLNDVVLGKYFDTFFQTRLLHRHCQSQSNVMNVDTAVSCQKRCLKKDPQMAASSAHFKCGLNPVLAQPVLELQQVVHRILVVGIDGHPLARLVVGIDRVQANRDLSLQVATDNVFVQFQRRAGPLVVRPEVIITPRFWMRPGRLQSVRPTVHKQPPVVLDGLRRYR